MIAKNNEVALHRYEAQATLFAPNPSRISLIQLKIPKLVLGEPTTVNVWRNHSFEPLQSLISLYSNFQSWKLLFRLGDYDDSLSFNQIQNASVELLWLDSNRYLSRINFAEWLEWFENRLIALRQLSSAPIIVATWLKLETQRFALRALIEKFPAVYFSDLEEACATNGEALIDYRSAATAGTPISGRAQVFLARQLVCHWIAGSVLPPIKAVALDLDNTLHAGVLGEDGVENVLLTENHKNLQLYIKELQKRGIFIALVSRNELEDVKTLFTQRKDYPLRWDDFSAIEVSWGEKADALKRVAMKLRISTDAMLFIDDNIGELAAVTQQLPNIHTIYAETSAEITRSSIEFYPGIWRWTQEADDSKRIFDLKAIEERESLALTHSDPTDYLRSLNVSLTFYWDTKSQLGRLSDLCRKTNQFNLALRRLNETELFDMMNRSDACVASVQLSDRLSDSGIIAVIAAERLGSTLNVVELCISCRALGRYLEESIILNALREMPIWKGCKSVKFCVQTGERNKPALVWLDNLMQDTKGSVKHVGHFIMPTHSLEKVPPIQGVALINGR